MNWIKTSVLFEKKAKRFSKKFHDFKNSLIEFNENILENPRQGILIATYLGNEIYKLLLKGKGKGKSGGFRIITFLVNESETDTEINLITVYDKSEESSINKASIQKLLKELY